MTVPFEATPEMVKAALDLVWEESKTYSDLVCRLWRAMAAVAPDPSSAARELALEKARSDLIKRLNDDIAQLTKMVQQAQFAGAETVVRIKSPSILLADLCDAVDTIRAQSSPDHADTGKVEGDGRADLERFWRSISEADKSITFEQTFDLGNGEKMTIRNSDHHYWVRDADGRVYEATWSDHKAGYWWDLEGESPVDPVEYMPHPLSFPPAPASEETKP